MGCRHNQRTFKIEKLYPTFEFQERLVFCSKCTNCGRLKLKLVYTRLNGSKWQREIGKHLAEEKYEELKHEVMCPYKVEADLHPELDIGLCYMEGLDRTVRKCSNNAVTENYFPPDEMLLIKMMAIAWMYKKALAKRAVYSVKL